MRIPKDKLQLLTDLATEVSEREGCRLYDLEVHPSSKSRSLRIVVDKPGEESPSLKDCESISKGMSLLLDVEDIVPGGAYQLEVSSPGIERKLRHSWHFEEAIGENLKVKCSKMIQSLEGGKAVKSFKAHLQSFDNGVLKLSEKNKNWEIPFDDIEGAQIIFDFSTLIGKKKKF